MLSKIASTFVLTVCVGVTIITTFLVAALSLGFVSSNVTFGLSKERSS